MQKCPICRTIRKHKEQTYCLHCAWEFEYYLNELSEEEKKRYNNRLQISKSIYNRYFFLAEENKRLNEIIIKLKQGETEDKSNNKNFSISYLIGSWTAPIIYAPIKIFKYLIKTIRKRGTIGFFLRTTIYIILLTILANIINSLVDETYSGYIFFSILILFGLIDNLIIDEKEDK